MARKPRSSSERATISDVARVAGVSRATVSRALNDSPKVTSDTKAKVQAAVEATGFVMSAQGRALALGRSEAIAVLFTEPLDEMFDDPTHATMLRGISDGLEQSPSMAMLLQASSESGHERVRRLLRRRAVDAVISVTPYSGQEILTNIADGLLPVVVCGRPDGLPHEAEFSHVYADDVTGAQLAARHLIDRGRRRVAILGGAEDNPAASDRLQGYRAVLGHRFDPSLVSHGLWDARSGFQRTEQLLASGAVFDGVLASSDRLAEGAIAALRLAGRRVPEDVAVVGFDDHAFALTTNPPLTTIRQPLYDQGVRAAQLALAMVDGEPARTVELEMSLVIRESA